MPLFEVRQRFEVRSNDFGNIILEGEGSFPMCLMFAMELLTALGSDLKGAIGFGDVGDVVASQTASWMF